MKRSDTPWAPLLAAAHVLDFSSKFLLSKLPARTNFPVFKYYGSGVGVPARKRRPRRPGWQFQILLANNSYSNLSAVHFVEFSGQPSCSSYTGRVWARTSGKLFLLHGSSSDSGQTPIGITSCSPLTSNFERFFAFVFGKWSGAFSRPAVIQFRLRRCKHCSPFGGDFGNFSKQIM